MSGNEHPEQVSGLDRRQFLRNSFCGFGGIALTSMLHDEAAQSHAASPLSARQPPIQPAARNVIFLFMAGGPSQLETFDHKTAAQQAPRPTATKGVRRGQVPVH